MFKKSLAVALAAATTLAAPAFAADTESSSVAVRYNDLDLSTERDQKTLEGRLDRAARDVCAMDQKTTGSRLSKSGSTSCYRQAREQLAHQFAEVVKNSRKGG